MNVDTEVRIRLPLDIHKKWQNAAAIRGLSLKGFIAATVSGELIRTGELNPVTTVTKNSTSSPQSAAAPKYDADHIRKLGASVAAEWADDDD